MEIRQQAARGEPVSEERDDVDLVLRHISRQFSEALARALVKTHDSIVVGNWIDTQVTGRQRRLDAPDAS